LAASTASSGGYRVEIGQRTFKARNVVIATGFFQRPKQPPVAAEPSPEIAHLHSGRYRNPESLPAGAVLVVGSAQSGCQIAEELYQRGHTVFLSTGGAGRAPRRYRGKDVIEWIVLTGFIDLTPEQLPPGMTKFGGIPHLSGTQGGHTPNLHQFARDGVTLLGRLRGASGHKVALAPDLHQNLAKADALEVDVRRMIDGFVAANGLAAPAEELPVLRDGFEQPVVEELDLKRAGVTTVVWATGYGFDYGLVKLPVRDGDGFPIQTRGVTSYPGLAFVGQPWMPAERSGFLLGVGDAAEHVVSAITDGAGRRRDL
jgi:putative flavoprotein involved in K+ transport